MINYLRLGALMILGMLLTSCTNNKPLKKKEEPIRRLSFTSLKGITYYEVKRRFSNGLSINEIGFQQEPSWIIHFKSDDSIMAYSPQNKIMQSFFLMYDHEDIYNFAREWFRIKKVSKDSLNFQRLQVDGKQVAKGIRSDVNITYYSGDYIKNTLKTTAEILKRPSKADTLYVKSLSERSNRNPENIDSAFAARKPVEFVPLSKIITVEKLSSVDVLSGRTESYDYLYPSYKIVIQNAYKDFAYAFTAIVDAKGNIYLGKFWGEIPEFHEARKKVLKGIINVYLQNLLKTRPGTTLMIPHSSEVTLQVVGKKSLK